MKIVMLSTSDITGGAAVVSKRLVEAFRALGHDARMIVLNRRGDSLDYIEHVGGFAGKFHFYGERAGIFIANGGSRKNLFKVSTASQGIRIADNKLIAEADVILLGWINQGFLSLKEIAKIARSGKKVIWTMHDMWCFTGICHLSGSCRRYRQHCGECPFLHRNGSPDDLSSKTWRKKHELYADNPRIEFVAVSHWLADRAHESSLLKDKKVSIIPNAFPIPLRPELNVNRREPIIAMGAARLDDPVKNLPLAIDALNFLYRRKGSQLPGLKAVFFGNIRNPEILDRLQIPFEWLGTLNEKRIEEVFNSSRVVLSTSFFEMLPTTIIEGLAWGCTAVATSEGGQEDIISPGENGYIVSSLSAEDVASAIEKAIFDDIDPKVLRESVVRRFDSMAVASEYLQLIEPTK